MFMGIVMYFVILEDKVNRVYWVKRFYDVLSLLKVIMVMLIMFNVRKLFY